MKLLGIDVGTGGTRTVVIDETGSVVAAATAQHAIFTSPQTGWAEQDPRDWWRAAAEANPGGRVHDLVVFMSSKRLPVDAPCCRLRNSKTLPIG